MSVYGKGKCLYGIRKKCRLGDEGIKVNPIYCLNCAILELAKAVKELKEEPAIRFVDGDINERLP